MKPSSIVRPASACFAALLHPPVRIARSHVRMLLLVIALLSKVNSAFAENAPIRGEIIINRSDAAWESQQVQEPCILPNPKDPSRLIMFYSGVPKTDRAVCAVGKAWTTVDEPFRWQQDAANPVFSPSAKGWDSRTLRLDTVLYIPEEDCYYIYYSGSSGTIQDRIGLAICPAGADGYSAVTGQTTQRVGDAPVLAPEPASPFFETMASQAAVWRERDSKTQSWKWYMYYSYRGKYGTLPGIRLATSTDGRHWARQFNVDDPRSMGQLFLSTPEAYYEWHQISKIGRTYVLCIEVGIEHGKRWRPVLAVSEKPDSGWVQLDVDTMLQTKWHGLYRDDRLYHVATPALYQIGGRWFLYAQACALPSNKNYIDGQWDLWCIACDREIETLPGLDRVFIPGAPRLP